MVSVSSSFSRARSTTSVRTGIALPSLNQVYVTRARSPADLACWKQTPSRKSRAQHDRPRRRPRIRPTRMSCLRKRRAHQPTRPSTPGRRSSRSKAGSPLDLGGWALPSRDGCCIIDPIVGLLLRSLSSDCNRPQYTPMFTPELAATLGALDSAEKPRVDFGSQVEWRCWRDEGSLLPPHQRVSRVNTT